MTRTLLTAELRARFEELYHKGLPYVRIAVALDISTETVARYRRKFQLPARSENERRQDAVLEMSLRGVTIADIAEALEISDEEVIKCRTRLRKLGNDIEYISANRSREGQDGRDGIYAPLLRTMDFKGRRYDDGGDVRFKERKKEDSILD